MDQTATSRAQRYADEKKKMQADRELINSLMMGHTELTQALAGAIYYKMIAQDIRFQSFVGEDFRKLVRQVLQTEGQKAVLLRLEREKHERRDNKKLFRVCAGTLLAVLAVTLLAAGVLHIRDTIGSRTDTSRVQEPQQEQAAQTASAAIETVQEELTMEEPAEAETQTTDAEQTQTTDAAVIRLRETSPVHVWMESRYHVQLVAEEALATVTLQLGFATLAPNMEELSVVPGSLLRLEDIRITTDDGEGIPLTEGDIYVIDGTQYQFIGWYGSDATRPKWDAQTDTVSGDMTLYAAWECIG